jgi:Monooxygenase af470-like
LPFLREAIACENRQSEEELRHHGTAGIKAASPTFLALDIHCEHLYSIWQKVFPGRYTARFDGPFAVFLIGMRINQLWAIHKWVPVASAMPRMLAMLAKNPDKGLLGVETWVRWREVLTVQYWRSFDILESLPATLAIFICRRGSGSTSRSAPTAASASGMRPMW